MEAHMIPWNDPEPARPPLVAATDVDAPFGGRAAERLPDICTLPVRRPSVDVVLVTRRSSGDLERCVSSLADAAQSAGAGVIVVGGSRDGAMEQFLAARGEHVAVIATSESVGDAVAINAAAQSSTADYLALLDPDVVMAEPDALERLVAHLEEHPDAGIVAPRVVHPYGPAPQSAHAGPMVDPPAEGHTSVEWAQGAVLLVRRADLDAIGGLSDGLVAPSIAIDLCLRMRASGRAVHYLPGVTFVAGRRLQAQMSRASRRAVGPRRARADLIARRAFDMTVAGLLLIAAAPALALTALAIKLSSAGPVLYRQRRLGLDAEPFTLLKFRTMRTEDGYDDVDHDLVRLHTLGQSVCTVDGIAVFKYLEVDRVTSVGRVLRSWSVDELPQLVNVLRGEMTLVGFRPPIAHEVEHYPDWYHRRFALKPGMTGLWQVSGRNHKSYEEMVRFDLQYIVKQSWFTDLKLLLRTVGVVLGRRGAV